MPNSGMLDHTAFHPSPREVRPRSVTYWMQPWPSKAGYQTLRSASARAARAMTFSRHLHHTQPTSQLSSPVLRDAARSPRNSVNPFQTAAKPTCGFHFSRCTDHTKRQFGIPPTNLAAWRTTRIRV